MIVLNSLQSDKCRHMYIRKFVDTDSKYYIEKIAKKKEFSDGYCYVGYLWDSLKNTQVISESSALRLLNAKNDIFIMWDIHSCDRILIPNYWKFPKSSILFIHDWSDVISEDLPDDIYVFDASFTWSVILTHETTKEEKRYCLYIDQDQSGDG